MVNLQDILGVVGTGAKVGAEFASRGTFLEELKERQRAAQTAKLNQATGALQLQELLRQSSPEFIEQQANRQREEDFMKLFTNKDVRLKEGTNVGEALKSSAPVSTLFEKTGGAVDPFAGTKTIGGSIVGGPGVDMSQFQVMTPGGDKSKVGGKGGLPEGHIERKDGGIDRVVYNKDTNTYEYETVSASPEKPKKNLSDKRTVALETDLEAFDLVRHISDLHENNFTGFFDSKVPGALGSRKRSVFRQMVTKLENMTTKAQSGSAVSAQEFKNLVGQLAKQSRSDKDFKATLAGISHLLNSSISKRIEVGKGQNFNVEPFEQQYFAPINKFDPNNPEASFAPLHQRAGLSDKDDLDGLIEELGG